MEALVVIALVTMAAGLVSLQVAGVRPAGERMARHQQQRALQEAVDRWLAAAPSLAAARQQFNGGGSQWVPGHQSEFLSGVLGPHLAPDAVSAWFAHSDEEGLRTPLWLAAREHLKVVWGPDWRRTPPRVIRYQDEEVEEPE